MLQNMALSQRISHGLTTHPLSNDRHKSSAEPVVATGTMMPISSFLYYYKSTVSTVVRVTREMRRSIPLYLSVGCNTIR